MYKALVFKELRETIGIAAIALLAYLAVIANLVGYHVLLLNIGPSRWYTPIPFLDNSFTVLFSFISVGFTLALGLWQTVVESKRGTWLFLLHRPMGLGKLIGVKLAIGAGVYVLIASMAILIYAVWAAMPGLHAHPFAWWMTTEVWEALAVILGCYFGAFLAGIRPGRWIGTRLLPIPAAGFSTAFVIVLFNLGWLLWGFMALVLLYALFVSLIFFVVRTRDFS